MTKFTRQELYDLVWSEPMRTLAAKYSISDRGLAKACAAANIPVPARGYWNKLEAGHKVEKQPLPHRRVGQSNTVVIGGNRWSGDYISDEALLEIPVPPEPIFEVSIDEIRQRVAASVAKAPLPKKMTKPHRLIAKILDGDEIRRQKYLASPYRSSWDAPIFDSAFEKRRLKILNALFICLEHCGVRASIRGKEARDITITVGDHHLSPTLDSTKATKLLERERSGYSFTARGSDDPMRFRLPDWRIPEKDQTTWEDQETLKLEDQLASVATELIVAGEMAYRKGEIRHREWIIERKAALIEKERQRLIEEDRKRREREAKLERQRIEHLLGQANALHQAMQIRTMSMQYGRQMPRQQSR